MSNIRIAELTSQEEIADYNDQMKAGCCGYYDEIFTHTSGRRFMIGFNYGH